MQRGEGNDFALAQRVVSASPLPTININSAMPVQSVYRPIRWGQRIVHVILPRIGQNARPNRLAFYNNVGTLCRSGASPHLLRGLTAGFLKGI